MNLAQNQSLKIFIVSLTIFIMGIITIYVYSYRNITKNYVELSSDIVSATSVNIENHFLEKVKTVRTIAITPVILTALEESNKHFDRLSEQQRDEAIKSKNIKWRTIEDHNHQFILKYTSNVVSQYLKNQQENLTGEYGEIFITDKYGALIASTAKLTTFAHGHKYWWKGAYNNGNGAVFLDDRGYDDSVGGYVLGVVVPIKRGNEIIGMLKANLNILGSISELIMNSMKKENEQFFLIRSGGLIVFKEGIEPLSKRISKKLLERIKTNENSFILKEEGNEGIYAISEIGITAGKQGYIFGGSFESIDHKKGNTGESWYIVGFHPISHIINPANKYLRMLFLVGLLLSVVLIITSMIIGNQAAKPIKEMIKQTLLISKGDYDSKVFTKRTDEIGQLAASFNQMTRNLKETTTSLDNLNAEIIERKKAEEALQKSNEELRILQKELEEKVKKTVAEIREKDHLLIRQSGQAAMGEMIGFIVHQWRQPLNLIGIIIQSYEDDFEHGIVDLKYLEEHSDKVMDVLQQMSRTLDDFRNFFKPDKLIVEFNLKDNIEKIIRFVESSYKTNNIKLVLDLDENCKARGFPNEYSQVILNILNNSRDAFDEMNIPSDKREVKIKLFKQNDKSIVTLSDTAGGISEEIINNIFESYFTTKSEDKGTGLGLYMSKTIIEDNMKGKLTARNIRDGAEFRIEV